MHFYRKYWWVVMIIGVLGMISTPIDHHYIFAWLGDDCESFFATAFIFIGCLVTTVITGCLKHDGNLD